jgi:hypothetical protein
MLKVFLVGNTNSLIEGLLSRSYSVKREQKSLLLDYLYDLRSDILQSYTVTDSSGRINNFFIFSVKETRQITGEKIIAFDVKILKLWRIKEYSKCN